MLRKKSAVATILTTMLAFTACGGATPSSAPVATPSVAPTVSQSAAPAASAKPEQTAVATNKEPVKISVWYAVSGASGEQFQAQVDAFNKSQSEVVAEATYSGSYADTAAKISASLMSNAVPEVAMMAAGPLYTGARGDFTMTKLMDEKSFNKSDFFPGTLEYATFDGQLCSIPYGISTPVFYYNKAITKAAGLDFEKNPPKTWDEVYEVAKIVKEKGNINNAPDFSAFDTSDDKWLFKTMLKQNENDIVTVKDGKTTPVFDNENAVAVGQYWKKLIDEGLMTAAQHANAEKKFLAGNLGFIVATSNRMSRWAGEKTVELGAIEMPYFKKPFVALGGNTLVMFPKDATKDAASWKLLTYLSTAENQTDFAIKTGYLPVRQSGVALPVAKDAIEKNPLYSIAFKQMGYSFSYWNFNEMGTMDMILSETLNEIESGGKDPQAALKDAADKLKKEIE